MNEFRFSLDALMANHDKQLELLSAFVAPDDKDSQPVAMAGLAHQEPPATPMSRPKDFTYDLLPDVFAESRPLGIVDDVERSKDCADDALAREADDVDDSESLDVARRETVKMHEFWEPASRPLQNSGTITQSSRRVGAKQINEQAITGQPHYDKHPLSRCIVMRPGSASHLTHAVISLFVIFYDIMSLPLTAAFPLDRHLATASILYVLDLTAVAFWSCDIAMNFVTGFHDNDRIEMRLHKICIRYMRTWFFFDMLVVSFDWVTLAISDMRGLSVARTLKSPRMLRIFLRTLRLLRVVKIMIVLEDVVQCVVSDWLLCTIGIAKMLLFIIVFNHFVACGWYAVGTAGEGPHWTDALDRENAGMFYRYISSFHWSMCQYTPAPNAFHPVNVYERLYACVTLLFGIAVFSSFLGKITSLLTYLSATTYSQARDEREVKQYLASNMVPVEVSNLIGTFLRNRKDDGRRMFPYSEVKNFEQLPKSLANELKFQSHGSRIRAHTALSAAESLFSPFLFKLCSDAINELGLKWGDEVFFPGSTATNMYFVKHGRLLYTQVQPEETNLSRGNTLQFVKSDKGDKDKLKRVGVGHRYEWVCEAALWCNWTHCGHLEARGVCVILSLDANALHDIVGKIPTLLGSLTSYAESFTRELNACNVAPLYEQAAAVDDCWQPMESLTGEVFHTVSLTNEQPVHSTIASFFTKSGRRHSLLSPLSRGKSPSLRS